MKEASFTHDEWPFNSLSVLPDLRSWILKNGIVEKLTDIKAVKKKRKRKSNKTATLTHYQIHICSTQAFVLTADKTCLSAADVLFLVPVERLGAD